MKSMRLLAAVAAAWLGALDPAAGQELRATIGGTVLDASGSLVVGARLTLLNIGTGVVFSASTGEAGQYRFLYLNPGKYRLTAEMTGFKSFVRDNIELQVNLATTIDLRLEVGALAETVTVSSEAPLLETEKVDRGVVIDQDRLTKLPLNIRNPIMLSAVAPGIIHTGGTQHLNPFSNSGISSWSVNGGPANHNEFLLDGAPNNTVYGGANRIAYVPTVDSVEEFKVMTGIYDAQYGRTGGGVINVSTKSGTNAFHGSGYEFLKRTPLNANTFSNNAKGEPRQGNALDQYGFSLGGPVWLPKLYHGRDRTFFFFAYEGYREQTYYPGESISSVPTVEQRRGDFSRTTDNAGRLITIYDQRSGRFVGNQWVREPFQGNRIPADRLHPVGQKILGLYPEPNTTTPGSTPWQNNFILRGNVGRFDFVNYAARIDHQFNERQRVYGRWLFNDFKQLRLINGIPGPGGNHRFGGKVNHGGVIDSVTMLGPRTILNLRASFTRWYEDLGPYAEAGKFDATTLGFPRQLVDQLPARNLAPRFNVSDFRELGPRDVVFEPTDVYNGQPSLAVIRGRHTLKAGLDFRLTRYALQRPERGGMQLEFNRAFTRRDYLSQDALSGNTAASLLLGYAGGGAIDNQAQPYWQWMYYAPFIQDDIKWTRRLTINLGLRWDLNLPPSERFNRMNYGFFSDQLNPISNRISQTQFPGFKAHGGIGFAGVNGLSRSPWGGDYDNLQPRAGAAYQLTDRTVIRGGWGIFHINPTSVGQRNGFDQVTPFVSSLDAGRTPATTIDNPFPTGVLQAPGASRGLETFLGQGPGFFNTEMRIPYVHQFSFGIQRQLPWNVKLDIAYVGSRTRRHLVGNGFNELSKENLALGDRTQGGNPNYLNERLPNPFAGLIPGTGLNDAMVVRSQLLRPYPQFTGFNKNNRNDGRIFYNSMQMVVEKRSSKGLSFLTTYTVSKNIDELNYLNAQDDRPTRTLSDWDRPHRFVLAPMYELPFGPGRKFLKSNHGLVSRLVGGWEAILMGVIQSGDPMSIPGNVYLLGDPRLPNRTYDRNFKTGVIEVDGRVRNVLPGEQPVFQVRQPFTLRTTPLRYGNLRNWWATTYDVSVIKSTRIREGMNLQFRAEAFNVLNTPVFSGDPNLTPTDTNFGRIFRDAGQSNFPRNIQLGFRLVF